MLKLNPYDPCDYIELNNHLNEYGIYFEFDLFNQVYLYLDTNKLGKLTFRRGRPPKISENTRKAALQMKEDGLSVRQIAKNLSISVGSVSGITSSSSKKNNNH